ncbi:lipocalin-like domain-containing protein [Sphingobacterium psychroaquaticum]|uniref:Lipocalin-like domain-containing protein n=1 Tax=Sphingobacterium psychroaquaticum TaxID=561061 RepID=A0A1X7INR5_9SPHI|nr:lipocalin-like domain-containing protein [Sphingobacterium psychroaquaticum]QBQ41322.1 hypothetical protein E2P86_09200 [Sphingobacterium psychroaquaticum]SMG16663.1 Lipocalin-like domain-containing protein [Sphingobacterium psychroaquaticum]
MTTLKNELVGTWKLLSYIEVPINGTDSLFPLGKNPNGLLIYAPDSFMSVQIAKEGRLLFESNDKLLPSVEEMESSIKGYLAFTGKYKVDNSTAVVHYLVKSALYPNWNNKVLSRKIDFEGDILYMKSVEPTLSNGQQVNSYMTWQKVDRSIDDFFDEGVIETAYISNSQYE